MNKPLLTELFFTLILTILIVLLFNPMHIWMPMAIHLVMVAMLLAVFSIVSIIIFKHIGEDEREQSLRISSYQTAYVAACGVLTTAVIVQSFSHTVDPWIVAALVTMLTVKFISLLINHLRR